MKKTLLVMGIVLLGLLLLTTCQLPSPFGTSSALSLQKSASAAEDADGWPVNPDPALMGPPPAATVPVLPLASARSMLLPEASGSATLDPAILTARLMPGQSISEHKTATLPADVRPRQGDIVFSFDLTGSMSGELNNVKNNAQSIMNAVRGAILDTNFGVVSHMDYPASYTSCNYSAEYGRNTGTPPYIDYAYRLDRSVTSDTAAVGTAIQGLVLGAGSDMPESYTRVFYESYADPTIGWRTGAKKIVLAWLDAVPHDCDYAEILMPTTVQYSTTGKDPGRDGLLGTGNDPEDADNLEILPVLQAMAAQNITLIVLYSGADTTTYRSQYGGLPLWQKYAEITGGSAFQINADGSIPGGTDIGVFVAGLITGTVGHLNQLSLQVGDPAYAGWLQSVEPASYLDITLDQNRTFDFDISIQVPMGTPDGEYSFPISLVGDGVVYAEQQVRITVYNEIAVPVDIKPGSCPNPLNVGSNGVVPAAVAGTSVFAVSAVDPASVRLEGVPALRWNYEDVTSPYEPFTGKPLDENACTLAGPDGFTDLTLKFDTVALAAALPGVTDGQVLALHLVGQLLDGTPIVGEDVVRIIKKK